ncbi:MAG: hypothetical protein HY063_02295 [Bacteroidetes bacterium]|nr:hypothetical protein [Bacteroidota bacterium]
MKKIFCCLVVSCFVGRSMAQFQAGIILGPQIPVGGFSNAFHVGVGFGITGKYFLKDNMAAGINLHYNSFGGDSYRGYYYYSDYHSHLGMTAFTGLFEYYFSNDKLKPYAGSDLGLYFWRYKYDYYWTNNGGNIVPVSGISHGTELGIAPMAGASYEVSDKFILNGNLKFNLMLTESNLNYIGFNFGAFYKFDK